MTNDLLLSCRCGAVRGIARDVSPQTVNHMICHCDDCQIFAHAIGRGDTLDSHGGSDIVQLSPACLEITAGAERLSCLRLTPKGMVRWYTGCCDTPVGNTLISPRPPFVGMLRAFIDRGADGRTAEELIGPSRAGAQIRWAKGDPSTLEGSRLPIRALLHMGRLFLRWWLRGDAARSPLRDGSGAPRMTPRVLTPEELGQARARAGL